MPLGQGGDPGRTILPVTWSSSWLYRKPVRPWSVLEHGRSVASSIDEEAVSCRPTTSTGIAKDRHSRFQVSGHRPIP